VLTRSRAALDIVTGLIGWPVFPGGRTIRTLVGAGGLALAGIVGYKFVRLAWKRQETGGWFEAAILLGTVTAAGVAFGLRRPDWSGDTVTFASRYSTPALIFWPVVALVPLVAMRHTQWRGVVAAIMLPIAAVMAIVPILWLPRAKGTMEKFASELKEGGIALTVGVEDPEALGRLAPYHPKDAFLATLDQARAQMDQFDLPPFGNPESDVLGRPVHMLVPPDVIDAARRCRAVGAPTDVAGFPLFSDVGHGRGVRLRLAYETFEPPPSSARTAFALDPSLTIVGLGATSDQAEPLPLTILAGRITGVPVQPASGSGDHIERVLVFARAPVAAVLLLDRDLQPRCLLTLPEAIAVPPA
jgi:hypothetical protein